MLIITLIGLVLSGTAAVNNQFRDVRTAQGPVRGYKDPDGNFYAFYGVPYATAPTGPNKFKGPLPPTTWHDLMDAVDKRIICPQSNLFLELLNSNQNYTVQEDCLIVNVFVPDTTVTPLPVVVHVHGGGFQIGFGNMVRHKQLLNTMNMIVVDFNYRLGAHGFLCLGTEDVPGNAGMKDQVAALRWVKRNIARFGGNPNDISVAGTSAGAAAVELLLVSKSARGLFNKVIPEGGSGVGVWAVQNDPLHNAKSFALSQGFDKSDDDIYTLENFFKYLPFDVLQRDSSIKRDGSITFVPCVERVKTSDVFLADAPVNIIKKGDYERLPILAGFADMEGIIKLGDFEDYKNDMNKKFLDFLPADLHFPNEDEREKVAQKIKRFYFGEEEVNSETALGFVNYYSYIMFVYPMQRSILLQVAAGSDSLYLYMYAFVDDGSPIPYPEVTGANHGAQSLALADVTWDPSMNKGDSEKYRSVQRLLTDVWKNFIISGKPTPKGSLAEEILGGEWLPTSPDRPHHALFNTTSELRGALLSERVKFWDDIYNKYYRTPMPPPELSKISKSEL